MEQILVTGSSGTIGTRLCENLIGKGSRVTGIDKRTNKWNKEVSKITIEKDLLKPDLAIPGADMIVHLAANARVYELVKNPGMAKENFATTFNMLEFARKNDIKKFIFASSREVYGNSDKTVHKEDEVNLAMCESPYTASKMAGEALVHAYSQCYGLDFVILRFSNVYGMYDDSDRVIPFFIRQTENNKDLVVYGKEKLLDFTYIDDCVNGIEKVIENFEKMKNDTFNIGSGTGTLILDVAHTIKKLMNGKNNIVVKPTRTGEVIKFIADISKIREKVSYKPKTGIETGIKNAIGWWKGIS